jgi:hypothetical protein
VRQLLETTLLMKNYSTIFGVTLLSCILSACKSDVNDSNNPSNSFDRPVAYSTVDDFISNGLDTIPINSFLRYSQNKWMKNDNSPSYYGLASAYFTNSTPAFVSCSSTVVVNGQTLTEAYTGNYHKLGAPVSSLNPIIWNIQGYEGVNVHDTSATPAFITYTSHDALDTVSSSSNLTLTYSGYGSGDVHVWIQSDPGNNLSFIDSASAYSVGIYSNVFEDDGSITVSSSAFTGFTTDRFILVHLTHLSYELITLGNGKKIGRVNTQTTSLPLYLD